MRQALLAVAFSVFVGCSDEPSGCPIDSFHVSDGDACDSKGLVCDIESWGECLNGYGTSARAECIKGRWRIQVFGSCPDVRPRGGMGGGPSGGRGANGGSGGRPGSDLDAGGNEDAGP